MKKNEQYNIVICDNHPVTANGLVALFESIDNCRVVGMANSGDNLRKLLAKETPNTLILDLKLPKTNIYRIVKDFVVTYPYMRMIVFTDYRMPKLIQDMMEFGVSAYLAKTASLSEVANTVMRVHNGEQFISPTVYESNKRTSNENIEDDKLIKKKDNLTRLSELTEREMDIIILLSRGMTNKEMATKLSLSIYTIETHRKNVMKKLQLKTSAQLIFFAVQQGIV